MKDLFHDLFFDLDGIQAVQQFFGRGHPMPFELLSVFGDTWGMIFVVGLVLWLWGRDAAYGTAGAIVLGAGTKTLFTEVVFSVSRPAGPGIRVYHDLATGSFPSGHVYMPTLVWTWLALLRLVPVIIPILIALSTSLGRLYLGMHYLGDVVFGALFAVPVAAAYYYLWPLARPWLRRRSTGFYAATILVFAGFIAASLTRMPPSPHRWEVIGVLLGTGGGLLLEAGIVDYRPAEQPWTIRGSMVLIGTMGIAACYGAEFLFPASSRLPGALLTAAAGLWATAFAPLLFQRIGWSQPRTAHAPGT